MIYIYNHLGLGDHIICNGLYRDLIKTDNLYSIFVKKHNKETLSFMLKDLVNVKYIEVDNDQDVNNFFIKENLKRESFIIIGFCQIPLPGAKDFDDTFYLQHNVNFDRRWSNFKCQRDIESERILFNKFNIKEGEYIFLHDDKSRGYEIDESLIINKNLPIIRPIKGLTNNSFDYCYLMENSIESHFIDSSFRLIFDSLQLRDENIFFHINLKDGVNRGHKPQSKLNFTIL